MVESQQNLGPGPRRDGDVLLAGEPLELPVLGLSDPDADDPVLAFTRRLGFRSGLRHSPYSKSTIVSEVIETVKLLSAFSIPTHRTRANHEVCQKEFKWLRGI